MNKIPPFADLYKLKEDDRIIVIGHYVMEKRMTVGIVVETSVKADTYITKLKEKHPSIVVKEKAPFKGLWLVRLAPPVHLN